MTGDWHIGVLTHGTIDERGRNSRLIDIEDTLNDIIKVANENEVDLLICTGDIFHTNRPTIDEQLIFWRFLEKINRSPCKFKSRFIIGNHDYNSKLGSSHALKLFMEAFNHMGNIVIYDETTWEYFGDDLAVCFYPYRGIEPTYAAELAQYKATALVCHSHLEGAVVGAEPFEIKSDHVTRFKDVPVDFIWAGHFHKPQVLCEKPLAFYPGSIQPVDFNERLDYKGVVICDTDQRSIHWEQIYYRRLVQIDIDSSDGVIEFTQPDLDSVAGCIVKVNITLPEKHTESFDDTKLRESLIAAGAQSVAGINVTVLRQEIRRNPSIKVDSDLKSNFELFLKDKKYGDLLEDIRQHGLQVINQCGY